MGVDESKRSKETCGDQKKWNPPDIHKRRWSPSLAHFSSLANSKQKRQAGTVTNEFKG